MSSGSDRLRVLKYLCKQEVGLEGAPGAPVGAVFHHTMIVSRCDEIEAVERHTQRHLRQQGAKPQSFQ